MATLLDELLLKIFGFLGCSVVRWVGRSVSRSVSPGLSSPPTSSRPQFNATWLLWNPRQKISLNCIGRFNYHRFLGCKVKLKT